MLWYAIIKVKSVQSIPKDYNNKFKFNPQLILYFLQEGEVSPYLLNISMEIPHQTSTIDSRMLLIGIQVLIHLLYLF